MTKISKKANVNFNADQMYALVNDIESYPDFLPWCTDTKIINSGEGMLTASVTISIGKIKKRFTTLNKMEHGSSISMNLIEGPFKELNGYWKFQNNSGVGSVVTLEMQFEFKNKLLKYTFGPPFKMITDSLVSSFIERAHDIYGE